MNVRDLPYKTSTWPEPRCTAGKAPAPPVCPEEERNHRVESNRGLAYMEVHKLYKKLPYLHRYYPIQDAEQDAVLGLMRAAELYDPTRGTTFGTMAVPWVRQSLQRMRQLQRIILQPFERKHKPCKRKWNRCRVISLQTLCKDRARAGMEYDSLVGPDTAADHEKHMQTEEVFALLLPRLEERDRQVIRMRYLDGLTNVQIGEALKISPQRVVQLEQRALERLRECLAREGKTYESFGGGL